MDVLTRGFTVNADIETILHGDPAKRTYTWNVQSTNDLGLVLNTCADFEQNGWKVALESPVSGVQRSYRIPVIAVKGETILALKPVRDPKKVNIAGLKMIDVKLALDEITLGCVVRPVVYAFMTSFDEQRKTSDAYDIWFRGANGIPNK